jgi:predicted nucleotidyltransferase
MNMISTNAAKLIRFLLRNLEGYGYNINRLAKSLQISVGSSFKILKGLEKEQLVIAQSIGNAINYNLNLDNPETIKICELLILKEKRQLSGYSKLYAESLGKFDKAEMIILFGSVLSKKEFNDIDVLFVADRAKEVNDFCLDITKTRTKPIVPLILKKKDLIEGLKKRNEALVSLVKEGVVLKGESTFIEVIRDAKK